MAFVDGENLLTRYEAMLNDGWIPRTDEGNYLEHLGPSTHESGRYIWNRYSVRDVAIGPLIRVNYYTTATGDSDSIERLESEIAGLKAALVINGQHNLMPGSTTNLVPRVFKKQKAGTKTKSVDVNICVDVLTQAYQTAVDDIVIISGDGDYAPLIRQTMSTGKKVHVAALSSGLSPVMRRISDQFIDLDRLFFSGRHPD